MTVTFAIDAACFCTPANCWENCEEFRSFHYCGHAHKAAEVMREQCSLCSLSVNLANVRASITMSMFGFDYAAGDTSGTVDPEVFVTGLVEVGFGGGTVDQRLDLSTLQRLIRLGQGAADRKAQIVWA
jgi:hypothetical protein